MPEQTFKLVILSDKDEARKNAVLAALQNAFALMPIVAHDGHVSMQLVDAFASVGNVIASVPPEKVTDLKSHFEETGRSTFTLQFFGSNCAFNGSNDIRRFDPRHLDVLCDAAREAVGTFIRGAAGASA